MRRTIGVVSTIWIALVAGSFAWNYHAARAAQERVAFQTARSFFEQVVITRRWNAQHGGVYVPVTGTTRPNPYLEDPRRDIPVDQALTLTKINPAFMTRQIAEIAATERGVRFRITSLNPLRPENRATEQERRALERFEHGAREVGSIGSGAAAGTYFYMAPLLTEQACLACHAKQGYREGDVRGGISVTLPFVQAVPLLPLGLAHLVIGLVGVAGIVVFGLTLDGYYTTLQQQSIIDALTGIPNRRSFSETILRELRRAKRENLPLSIVMCDIDRFKDYNDRYGHEAGDECLRRVAQVIDRALDRPGDFCARYGGEEFVVVLANTEHDGALHVAERVRARVQDAAIRHAASPAGVVTLSLGVATLAAEALLSNEDLIRRADRALYRAKALGRNRVEADEAPRVLA